MYDNRKEVIEDRKFEKDIKRIEQRLNEVKATYKDKGKSIHPIVTNSVENNLIVDNFVWGIFEKLLLDTTSFSNNHLTLLTKIYDGLGLDSYYFLLENNLLNDKFLRGQVVITVKDVFQTKAGTKMIVKMKFDAPSFAPNSGDSYLCEIIGSKSKVCVNENEIKAVN